MVTQGNGSPGKFDRHVIGGIDGGKQLFAFLGSWCSSVTLFSRRVITGRNSHAQALSTSGMGLPRGTWTRLGLCSS